MIPHVGDPFTGVCRTIATFEQTWRVINRTKRSKIAAFGSLGTLPTIRVDHIGAEIAAWYWGIGRWLRVLFDTLLMAFMGTFLGVLGALILCFPAARNLTTHGWTPAVCRRLLDLFRTVPELVFSLIFVYAFGLGSLPGVLAIAMHSMGARGLGDLSC